MNEAILKYDEADVVVKQVGRDCYNVIKHRYFATQFVITDKQLEAIKTKYPGKVLVF
jgi:hypothetical protein